MKQKYWAKSKHQVLGYKYGDWFFLGDRKIPLRKVSHQDEVYILVECADQKILPPETETPVARCWFYTTFVSPKSRSKMFA